MTTLHYLLLLDFIQTKYKKDLLSHSSQVLHIKENGGPTSVKVMECRSGRMEPDTKASGSAIEHAAKESSSMLMGTCILESGRMTKPTGMVCTYIVTVHDTKDIGKMTIRAVMVSRNGQTIVNMMETTDRAKKMVKDIIYGQMEVVTRENG
jgi:hypothetical protein